MKKPYIICHMMMSVNGRIDCGMTATFDGLLLDTEPVNLKLLSVQPYDNGAVWLRYALP